MYVLIISQTAIPYSAYSCVSWTICAPFFLYCPSTPVSSMKSRILFKWHLSYAFLFVDLNISRTEKSASAFHCRPSVAQRSFMTAFFFVLISDKTSKYLLLASIVSKDIFKKSMQFQLPTVLMQTKLTVYQINNNKVFLITNITHFKQVIFSNKIKLIHTFLLFV